MLFDYKILSKTEGEQSGQIEAHSKANAVALLQGKGYVILTLSEKREAGFFGSEIRIFQRVKTSDLVIFSRQVATLFEAEVSALRTFNLVAENMPNQYFKEILRDIAKQIERGSSIEDSFKKYTKIFGNFFVSIVAVGEQSGTLSRSFSYLADYTERYNELISRVRRAMTYPIFVITVFFAIMLFMFATVIPQIASILEQSGKDLPVITEIILSISRFVNANALLIILVIVAGIILSMWYYRTTPGRKMFHTVSVEIPLIGKLVREFYLVRFADNLSVMLASGVPIIVALDTVTKVINNVVYKEALENISQLVRQGAPLSTAIRTERLLSEDLTHIIRVGEESGELSKILSVVANFYDQQLQTTIATVIELVQPTVIVFLGLAVGVLIGAVILPIYNLSGAL